jgi:hypothetical protein
MRVRYSSIPVVAPHGMTFGGGCEMSYMLTKLLQQQNLYGLSGIWRWSYTRWWWLERDGVKSL